MGILKEIDKQAKVEEFRLFLEAVKLLDPADIGDTLVAECVHTKIDMLNEMGRGDFGAHMDMATAAGVRGHETDARVTSKLGGKRRLGLQAKNNTPQSYTPEKGQHVVYQGKSFVIDDTDGRIAFLSDPDQPFGGDSIKIDDIRQLKPVKTKSGGIGWVWLGR